MNFSKSWMFGCWLLCVANASVAYEIATHARLTHEGYLRSDLSGDEALLKGLGLASPQDASNPFGQDYVEILPTGFEVDWTIDGFEQGVFYAAKLSGEPTTISGWLMRGAVREDDFNPGGICNLEQKNPTYPGLSDRPLNHFFDPINDDPLTVVVPLGDKAPDWGAGAVSAFDAPLLKDNDGSDNHFSIFQARESEYRALTGLDTDGNPVASDQETRNKYWATTFRTLGDLVHLIQDMAQPQHTRNDPHSGACWDAVNSAFAGHTSVYEKYIESAVIGKSYIFEYLTKPQVIGQLPPLNTYPTPRFDDYASYFSTRHLDAAGSRRGLADYSNYGFFSSGTNMDDSYANPSNTASSYTAVTVNAPGLPPGHTLTELRGAVEDQQSLGNVAYDVPLTTEGLWTAAASYWGGSVDMSYALTRSNYDAMAAQLLPRAVAYSAGILNYFFRGRLELQVDGFSANSVSVKLRNSTFNETLYGQRHVGSGTSVPASLMLVYEYTDAQGQVQTGFADNRVDMNVGHEVPFGQWDTTSYTFSFNGQPVPADATELRFRLIFRGRLGNEYDAIAVGYLDATSPGFIFTPVNLPADGIGGSRWMHKADGIWQLDPELTGLEGGNIDWKGRYVNGKPGAVLSWAGPKGRSVPEILDQGFESNAYDVNIYKDGTLYAVAPIPVLGAMLYTDPVNSDWLIAICKDGADDVVFRKPNIPDTSPALWDQDTAPNGWRTMARFNRQQLVTPNGYVSMAVDQPWLASGDGSEAQTMWLVQKQGGGTLSEDVYYRGRLKITISGDSAVPEFFDPFLRGDIAEGKALVSIDYKDNEERWLEIDSQTWLTVNGVPLVPDPELFHVRRFNWCAPDEGDCVTFIESTSLTEDGFNASDYNKEFTTGVYVNVHYIDLREDVIGLTVSHYLGAPQFPTSGSRYLLKGGRVGATDQWSGGQPYVPFIIYTLADAGGDDRMGEYYFKYSWFNKGMARPSTPNCAVARDSAVFCSTWAVYGLLNYLEGGDAASAVGVPSNTRFQGISPK